MRRAESGAGETLRETSASLSACNTLLHQNAGRFAGQASGEHPRYAGREESHSGIFWYASGAESHLGMPWQDSKQSGETNGSNASKG